MKFYSFAISALAIIIAAVAAIFTAWQGQYFRGFLLALFIVIQVDVLAIRMHLERDLVDPDTLLRRK